MLVHDTPSLRECKSQCIKGKGGKEARGREKREKEVSTIEQGGNGGWKRWRVHWKLFYVYIHTHTNTERARQKTNKLKDKSQMLVLQKTNN